MARRILRRGIYWAFLNPTVGQEQAGTRPVLIASIDSFNINGRCAIAFPITSKQPKVVYPLVYKLPNDLLPKPSWVKISQIRTLSTDRLGDFVVKVNEEDLEQILSGFDRLVGRRLN
jgi:mRNA interferase MazF